MQIKRKSRGSPKPPDDLSESMQRFWRKIVAGWELEDFHLRILEAACRSWDRAAQAAAEVAKAGAFFVDRHGRKMPHPGIAVELANRKMFIAALREIGLDVPPPNPPRAPGLPHYLEYREE